MLYIKRLLPYRWATSVQSPRLGVKHCHFVGNRINKCHSFLKVWQTFESGYLCYLIPGCCYKGNKIPVKCSDMKKSLYYFQQKLFWRILRILLPLLKPVLQYNRTKLAIGGCGKAYGEPFRIWVWSNWIVICVSLQFKSQSSSPPWCRRLHITIRVKLEAIPCKIMA